MRSPELFSELQLPRIKVDSDNFISPGKDRALHNVEPYASAANDRDTRPWLYFRGIDDRADPCHHAAAHQRRGLQRYVRTNLDNTCLWHNCVLGERGDAGKMPNLDSPFMQSAGAIGEIALQ